MDAGGRATQDAKAEGWGEGRGQTALGRIALTPGPSPKGEG